MSNIVRQSIAEALGTFTMVFCGTGAIIINQEQVNSIGHVGIALTFGLVVLAMIYTYGDISGAHFNPAVTWGFYLAKRINKEILFYYLIFQFFGAFLASLFLHLMFPLNINLGATLPANGLYQSFILEIFLSLFLMQVILHVANGAKETGILAGIAIGSTVGLEALFAGPISGASMNPFRSLAPALVSLNFIHIWIYLLGPMIGTSLAVFTWKYLKNEKNQDSV